MAANSAVENNRCSTWSHEREAGPTEVWDGEYIVQNGNEKEVAVLY